MKKTNRQLMSQIARKIDRIPPDKFCWDHSVLRDGVGCAGAHVFQMGNNGMYRRMVTEYGPIMDENEFDSIFFNYKCPTIEKIAKAVRDLRDRKYPLGK